MVAPPNDDHVLDTPADVQLALPQEAEVAGLEIPVGKGAVSNGPFGYRRGSLSSVEKSSSHKEWSGGMSFHRSRPHYSLVEHAMVKKHCWIRSCEHSHSCVRSIAHQHPPRSQGIIKCAPAKRHLIYGLELKGNHRQHTFEFKKEPTRKERNENLELSSTTKKKPTHQSWYGTTCVTVSTTLGIDQNATILGKRRLRYKLHNSRALLRLHRWLDDPRRPRQSSPAETSTRQPWTCSSPRSRRRFLQAERRESS